MVGHLKHFLAKRANAKLLRHKLGAQAEALDALVCGVADSNLRFGQTVCLLCGERSPSFEDALRHRYWLRPGIPQLVDHLQALGRTQVFANKVRRATAGLLGSGVHTIISGARTPELAPQPVALRV